MGIAHQTEKFRAMQANPALMAEARARVGVPAEHQPQIDAVPVKETGLLMRPELALLTHQGDKTNTRRLLKLPSGCSWYEGLGGEKEGWWQDEASPAGWWHLEEMTSPYGRVGDRIWIREEHYLHGRWTVDRRDGRLRWSFKADRDFGAQFDSMPNGTVSGRTAGVHGWYKRNSLFMPRWACRTVVELTDVRVERLQDISEADAIAEGVVLQPGGWWSAAEGQSGNTARAAYGLLWNSINGAGSWDANPWVWSLHFRKVPACPA